MLVRLLNLFLKKFINFMDYPNILLVTEMFCSPLPAIEFAINSARSESTGYVPFFLNTGRMPRSMIWTSAKSDKYPTVRMFTIQRKLALISAHDSILAAQVKKTRNANRKRQLAPFKENDLFSLGDESEGEWAVDKILSHSGSKENVIFEILWLASDITWLPYHQISHSNALPVYLDLLGISGISERSSPLITLPFCDKHTLSHTLSLCTTMFDTNIILPDAPPITALDQVDPAPVISVGKKLPRILPHSIIHTQIKRLSCTNFLATDPIKEEKYFFHAGQMASFCSTDAELRHRQVPDTFPAGYCDFTEVFNTHIEDNPICFTTYNAKTKGFNLNSDPVTITDFYITEEDIGSKPHANKPACEPETKPRGKKCPAPESNKPTPSSSSSNVFTPLIVEPKPEPAAMH
ncbi:hypothetical protein K443DRAFT_134123 [Laccaria amethystina LaAM-08-1]|uniref:Uncharacterized protein n=1 Tax=Laccaria amethystina LaAM-08-1 TaxID=1095629 RepID=A0A0C9WVI4_9AGAR|nr:hypothetical protein K443DRAFT_134123 [Laccaria amethystina LaAM-08-1]